jgi:hypothetical protein
MTSTIRSDGFEAGNSSRISKTITKTCVDQLLGSKTTASDTFPIQVRAEAA